MIQPINNFLDRIVADDELEPGRWYLCDLCNQLHKGHECRLSMGGSFIICKRCDFLEENYGAHPKEGEIT